MNNSKTLKWILIILIISNVASISGLLYHILTGNENLTVMPPGWQRRESRVVDHLGLDDEQFNAFRGLKSSFHQDVSPKMFELQRTRVAFFNELEKQNPDKEKLKEYASRVGQLQKDIKQLSIGHYLEIKKILTPRQQKNFFHALRDLPGKRYGRGMGKCIPNCP